MNKDKLITNTIIGAAMVLTAVVATKASAENSTPIKGTVMDYYSVVQDSEPYTKKECVNVNVPVYGTVQKQGNAAEGALLGMILGGLVGKGVTGDDKGAAAGAIFGGLVGADKGAKPKPGQGVTGWRVENRCDYVTYYRQIERTEYSYSIINWEIDGITYTTEFVK
jgi:uncharacterized protein YcfJ